MGYAKKNNITCGVLVLLLVLPLMIVLTISIVGFILSNQHLNISNNVCNVTNISNYNSTVYGCIKQSFRNCYEYGYINIVCQNISYTISGEETLNHENMCPGDTMCGYNNNIIIGEIICFRKRLDRPYIYKCKITENITELDVFLYVTGIVCLVIGIFALMASVFVVCVAGKFFFCMN